MSYLRLTIATTAALIIIFSNAPAQITFEQTYGGNGNDNGASVVEVADGYVIAGFTDSYGVGGDVYVLKIDFNGDLVWEQNHGGSSTDVGQAMVQTSDGGFVIAGRTLSYGNGNFDVYLLKVDANGNYLWHNTYGGSEYDEADHIAATADGGFIIGGYTSSFGSASSEAYIIKTDENGDSIWAYTYSYPGPELNEQLYSISQTSDSGYIAAGLYMTWPTHGYVLKVNSAGVEEWSNIYTDFRRANHIFQNEFGEYVVTGVHTESSNSYIALAELNLSGQIINQWNYGDELQQYGNYVIHTGDDKYVVAGQVFLGMSYDAVLLKTLVDGTEMWKRYYGGENTESVEIVQETSDGGFIMVGHTATYGPGPEAVYVLKTDSVGNIENTGIDDNNIKALPNDYILVKNYPNPFNASTIIEYKLPTQSQMTIEIYDILGKLVTSFHEGLKPAGDHQVIWQAEDISSGIYFYKLQAGDYSETKRMLLIK